MHYHYVEDSGQLVEVIPFCCASCHQQWCQYNDVPYGGWNGCQEGGDSPEWCANCGVFAGGTPECDCQRDNVLVNRFRSSEGEKCEHGHWLQLPERMLK